MSEKENIKPGDTVSINSIIANSRIILFEKRIQHMVDKKKLHQRLIQA